MGEHSVAFTRALWCLRVTVALQCIAAARTAWVTGSAVNGWLFMRAGVAPDTANLVDRVAASALAAAAVSVLVRPWRVFLLIPAVWIAAIMVATRTNPGSAVDYLAPAAHAVRLAAPLGLIAWLAQGERAALSRQVGVWILLVGSSASFAAHGLEALNHHGQFVDLLIGTARRWTVWDLSQSSAENALVCIGTADLLLAALLLARRWRWVAGWMALWGLVTALSRMTAMGGGVWFMSAERAANAGVPLALSLAWWQVVRSHAPKTMTMLTTALLVLFTAAPQDEPWTALEGTVPVQWRVIWTEDPAHRATVSWSTLEAGSEHVVHFDVVSREGTDEPYAMTQAAQRNGAYTLHENEREKVAGASYHHARIGGLEPSTTYWFRLESDGVRSPELHFETAPAEDRPFRMIHGGDSRSGHEARLKINTYISLLTDEHPDLIAFAHGGDYILWGELWTHWRPWLSHHEVATSPSGRVLPLIPARGNHDVGPLFDEIFDDPGGAKLNYYATDITPQVSLVTINTEISAAGDQAVWLEDELARLRPQRRWLLAQYHRAIYPAVKGPADAKAHWVPLFEEHDLDVALESDGHVAKRTVPIRGEAHDESGVVYIGEGGLGVPQRVPRFDQWFLQEPGMCASAHHVVMLEFAEGVLISRILGLPESYSRSFTPRDHVEIVGPETSWRYLAGGDPAGDAWRTPGFDDSDWRSGAAGIGFGGDGIVTVLEDMRGAYSRVYLRARFDPALLADLGEVRLAVRYDDGFVAYLNGVEVARGSVGAGSGAEATDVEAHTARSWELFSLGSGAELVRQLGSETAVIAIEGHNKIKSSNDFHIEPCLIGPHLERPPLADETVVLDELRLVPRDLR
ncbi:MAG: metallophosphoesterase family protein [Planctomycetota bacterium]|jgi:hypothetical protein|nr:metallophosphoesterase family protein [Planctomycetota bacterium]MDP6761483.1 metallophosphoesterase family protein [Planctomycetota bacterium]MDP6989445.1 metallophosphoesterase family protein [Planctomycetota bacterium]